MPKAVCWTCGWENYRTSEEAAHEANDRHETLHPDHNTGVRE